MLVVSDTLPINYLILMQQETLLPILYERVIIPPAVHEELQRSPDPGASPAVDCPSPVWLSVQRPQQPLSVRQFPRLDDGELEAIPLAQALGASFLLMDDFEGREEAERRVLTVTGTLGVLEMLPSEV
jgi:predicted nucleic acid-binding protein